MLRELRIRNFAIIDELDVSFRPGLNVLTGETGAGKSIIIGALGIALGERAYAEMIKTGRETASVEAYFEGRQDTALRELGIPSKDDIIIRRTLSTSGGGGKSKAYINDTMVSVQGLAELGRSLVDIHGQHEHQSLLSTENQLRLLDRYGRLEGLRTEFQERFSEVEALKKRIAELKSNARQREERLDLLRFQISEIKAAALAPGDEARLLEERAVLSNLSRLSALTASSYELLYSDEGSGIEKLSQALSSLKEASAIDKSLAEPLSLLESALPLIQDASHSLRDSKDRYEEDPERLSRIEERLETIRNLKKKYGGAIEAILAYMEKAGKELDSIETSDGLLEGLEKGLGQKSEALEGLASALSEKRRKAAKTIEKTIRTFLKELAMEKSEFEVEIKKAPLSPSGADAVEFIFSANPGEALKPLVRVASGGELSRIMLAIKSALGRADEIPVLVFDEVDAGIGGRTAHAVARKLKEISEGRQVLCITHLPQIASAADSHLLIDKSEKNGGVHVSVRELSEKERHEEIARMLGGNITETALKHAKEIIKGGAKTLFKDDDA